MAAAAARTAPIQVIKRVWERIAPLSLAETSWDNVSCLCLLGSHSSPLQVGIIVEAPFPSNDAKQVLLTIE